MLSTDIKAAAPGMHLSDLHADLKSWAAAAPTAGEATVRASASHVISDAFQCRGESLDLSGRGLTSLPDSLGGLTQLKQLNVSDNPLQAFPTKALLTLTSLQTLQLGMNKQNDGVPFRRSHERFADEGYKLQFFAQGNNRAQIMQQPPRQKTALFTTDLAPCLAAMIVQDGKSIALHMDNPKRSGSGGLPLEDAFARHLLRSAQDTQVFLVGANDQGSAGNVRAMLSTLDKHGLANNISMASLGNGHTSATLDVNNRQAWVGFG
ncbi:leucine-rich repeat domain-containing protein [[Pantoea] beijingensis]|uniref:leucine-rich repeat domain-containing protein n=1 Tax=[Pantoea] beijingensis TaxID=1324864 RepID=UPI000FE2FC99|nr:leucine-rich repeat domain-containing protein [[Pantoea] beijingensis]